MNLKEKANQGKSMADYKKSIEFKAKLDTSDVGPTIENLKKQFEEVSRSVERVKAQTQTAGRLGQQGYGGMSVPKPEEIQKSKRALDTFIKEQSQQQEKLYKLIGEQKEKVEKLQNIKKNMLKDSKEELSIEEKKIAAKEALLRLEDQYQRKDLAINKALDLQTGKLPSAPGAKGISRDEIDAINAETDRITKPKIATMIGKGANILGMAAGALAATAEAKEWLAGFPMRLEQAKGSAVEGLVGRDISAVQSGNAQFELPWMAERAKAAEMSKQRADSNRTTDLMKGIAGSVLLGIAPIIAATGAGIPAAAISAGSGIALLKNDRSRSKIFGNKEEYEKLLGAEQTKDTLETWEDLKRQDPKKRAAIERLQQRYTQDLQTQRLMGLSYEQFTGTGGFQQRANKAGFNDEMARAMAVQMQGAGGSTRGMRDLSTLGLQAQKGFDLTNVGNILGKISGAAGGGQASEQIFRRLMEESIKAGLDKSEFREEQRKYAEMTSEMLSQSGVKTAEDAEKVLQGFSRYLGEKPTVRELTGARSAYEEAQGFSAETSGRGGAIQFAAMLKHPSLKALGAGGMAGLMEMKDRDLVPSNPYIIAEAAKAGVTPEQLIKDTKDSKLEKQYTELGLDKGKVQNLNKYLTKRGMDKRDLTTEDLNKMKAEAPEQLEEYLKLQEAATYKSEYVDMQKRQGVVRGLLRGQTEEEKPAPTFFGKPLPGTPGSEFEKKMLGITGRPEDEAVAATGVAAQALLENFRNFKEVITPATSALDEFIKKIMAVKTAIESNQSPTDAMKKYFQNQPLKAVDLQTQGGKPKQ